MIDTSKFAKGIDCYHGDGAIDWVDLKVNAGVSFAFIKATQGRGITDPLVSLNADNANRAGVLTGPYHYLTPQESGNQQALHFCKVADADPGWRLPWVVDVEQAHPDGADALTATLTDFCYTLSGLSGEFPMIYLSPSFANEQLSLGPEWAQRRLWLAQYGPEPHPPAPWTDWNAWQWDEAGAHGHTYDVNYWQATEEELQAAFPPH